MVCKYLHFKLTFLTKINIICTATFSDSMLEKRKQFGLSQQDVADILGVSRPTVIKMEKGVRKLSMQEEQTLAVYFESLAHDAGDARISIPQQNLKKFQQVLLYILDRVGAKPNVGLTVLYKLLYFIDFDYYEKYEEQLMGLTYFKNTHGPTPREFKRVIEQMVAQEQIEAVKSTYFKREQKKYLPRIKPDLAVLNGRELEMIESVLDRYSDKNAVELSEMSHRDTPWKVAEDREDLDYEAAFYRPDEFSVREYDAL